MDLHTTLLQELITLFTKHKQDANWTEAALRTICRTLQIDDGALYTADRGQFRLQAVATINNAPLTFKPIVAQQPTLDVAALERQLKPIVHSHQDFTMIPLFHHDQPSGLFGFVTKKPLTKSVREALPTWQAIGQLLADSRQTVNERDTFARFAQTSPNPIIITDSTGQITFFNKPATQLFGERLKRFLHEPIFELYTEEAKVTLHNMYRAVPKLDSQKEDLVINGRFQQQLAVLHHVQPLRNERGELLSVVIYLSSHNRERQLKEQLSETVQELEFEKKLWQHFTSSMKHEMRTPLNAIVGLNQLLLKTDLPHRSLEYVKKIDQATRTLLSSMNRLIEYSDLENKHIQVKEQPFNIHLLIENISNLIEPQTLKTPVKFKIDVDHTLFAHMIGDPQLIEQSLNHLIDNALKFTEEGTVTVKIKVVQDLQFDTIVEFAVEDTGFGISEDAQLFFDPTRQIEFDTTQPHNGIGLGLTIVNRYMNLLHSQLEVKPLESGGSRFAFQVRLKKNLDHQKFAIIPDKRLRQLKVLVVDDNSMSRLILEETLRSFSFRVTSVGSAAECITILKKQDKNDPFALLIMDWMMPELDGISLLRLLRDKKIIAPSIKAILVSAFGRTVMLDKATQGGFDSFVTKPIQPYYLLDAVTAAFKLAPQPTIATPPSEVSILLVEDNYFNQLITRDILEKHKMIVDVAANGIEAVEKATAKSYNAIIMDLHMPEMDGFGATTELRQRYNLATPIIAMTASTLDSERAKALQLGMNDYLTKPIQKDELLATIARWTNFTVDYGNFERHEAEDMHNELTFMNWREAMQRLNGNETLLTNLLHEFANKYADAGHQLSELVMKGDILTAARFAHTLKGVTGNLSMKTLYELAFIIETLCLNDDGQDAIPKIKEFQEQLAHVIQAIHNWASFEEDAILLRQGTIPIEPSFLHHYLVELHDHLTIGKVKRAKMLIEHISNYSHSEEEARFLQQIEKFINRYQLENALPLADQWIATLQTKIESE